MGLNVLNWTTILLIALVRNLGAIITNLFGSLIYDNYQIIWNLTSVSWTVQAVLSYCYDASLRHYHIIISYMHYNKSLTALSSYSLAFFQHIFHRAISVIFLKYKPSRDNPLIKTIQWLSISLRVNEAFYYLALTSFSFCWYSFLTPLQPVETIVLAFCMWNALIQALHMLGFFIWNTVSSLSTSPNFSN